MGWRSGREEEGEEEEEAEEVVVVVVPTHHSLQNVSAMERLIGDFGSPRADGVVCLGCWECGFDDRAVAS